MRSPNHTVVTPNRTTAFGPRLRDLRVSAGHTQRQLAHASGLSVRAIRDLENGRVQRPRAVTLRLLAGALGLSAPQLDRLTRETTPRLPPRGPLLGRETELAALTAMLGSEQHRLVTITGLEGVGKTRLALEVARTLDTDDHPTPLWLSPHGPPHNNHHNARRLSDHIGHTRRLLVIDGARPGDTTATHLLTTCPRLRIVVTTRDPADLPPDTLFPLAPLPVPPTGTEPADLGAVPSVSLLLTRLARTHPAFRPNPDTLADIARICRALDGLPAALEAAARWSLVYSPRQLAQQLTTDPLTVARGPDGHPGRATFASVPGTVAALSRRQRHLLAAMSRGTSTEPDGYWSVPHLARTVDRTAADCADDIYRLLVLGVVRRADHHHTALFKVLNIVSEAGCHAAA
ncbi:helix-turn-helix domain-containing protein [Actinokineospora auranticolor]|uniref:Helix-turn-helix protein n=1 Tax=Actinokineospora auranticolor TaxID=155976 RepID=A0A2S6GJE7_9PSEU|nr:helix-turn-helix domain-containing protein [Actinokineospora auranticolor]PPK65271.1 helix-turn-helix protein [Actinokineospora auranticolor]